MKYEIIGRPPNAEDVRKHFFAFLDELEKESVTQVKIMFGFAWGNFVYKHDWLEELCSPAEVRRRVEAAELEKKGKIGSDDFYISVPGTNYERTYCHEADIHFSSDAPNSALQSTKEEWRKLGWTVHEQVKDT